MSESMAYIDSDEVRARVESVVTACLDRKAADLRVLNIGEVSSLADYFVICSTSSERQSGAVADAVEKTLRERHDAKPIMVEGRQQARWILLDYGDFVVHVFTEEVRMFYRLERLWEDAPDVTAALVSEIEAGA